MEPKEPNNLLDIKAMMAALTLEEKAALCSGLGLWNTKPVPRLGIPSLCFADGPHGLRKPKDTSGSIDTGSALPATCFPTATVLASTWNRDLISTVGDAIAKEASYSGVDVLLGPCTNIKRSPLGGRNFEYYSEDPYLSGEISSAFITGVQSSGVGACLKHFAANNQETRRFVINSVIDDKALYEIYLKPFEIAVSKAHPWAIMASYNKLNGSYATESSFLLTDTLRHIWAYEGAVISDWGAVDDRVAGIRSGMDLEMPGRKEDGEAAIIRAVKSGKLPEELLNSSVERILNLINMRIAHKTASAEPDMDRHHQLAIIAAEEGAVLLKNDGAILPLANSGSIALIGSFSKKPRYQGAGSSFVEPTRLDSAFDAITSRFGSSATITFAPGYNPDNGNTSKALLDEAVKYAATADTAVVFAGLPARWETEGLDRDHMRLPEGQNKLIEAVSKANRRTIVVLMNGAPLEMPWIESVPSVLEAYLSGQGSGRAISNLLFGDSNPSGKLAESFPVRLEDNPSYASFPGDGRSSEYRESIYVGYRYYEKAGIPVLFPFGHGLSYTSFEYSDISVAPAAGDDGYEVSFKLRNTGKRQGAEVVQLYVASPTNLRFSPIKELKGFQKITLGPNEESIVRLHITHKLLDTYDSSSKARVLVPGEYSIMVGSSSQDIRLHASLEIAAEGAMLPVSNENLPLCYIEPGFRNPFDEASFVALTGRPTSKTHEAASLSCGRDTPIEDIRGVLGFKFRLLLRAAVYLATYKQKDDPALSSAWPLLRQMPLKSLPFASGGAISGKVVDALIMLFNGHPIGFIKKLLGR